MTWAALAPGAGLGTLLLVLALVQFGRLLGWALLLAGGTYVGAAFASGRAVDPTAPLAAVLLLLSAELCAWSLDERAPIGSDDWPGWHRAAALASLAFAGLVAAATVVVLAAVPSGHGLAWTVAGAAAAVGAAGTGTWLVTR